MCGATVLRRARPHRSDATRHLADERRRRKRTAQEGEALRQKRRDFVRVDGDERARGNGVMTPHGATGNDREDGQEQARGKPAATAVGEGGAVTAKTPRMTTIPSHQRATDSHNNTRPVALRETFVHAFEVVNLIAVSRIERLRCIAFQTRSICDVSRRKRVFCTATPLKHCRVRSVVQHIRAKMAVNYFFTILMSALSPTPKKRRTCNEIAAPYLTLRITYTGLY